MANGCKRVTALSDLGVLSNSCVKPRGEAVAVTDEAEEDIDCA